MVGLIHQVIAAVQGSSSGFARPNGRLSLQNRRLPLTPSLRAQRSNPALMEHTDSWIASSQGLLAMTD